MCVTLFQPTNPQYHVGRLSKYMCKIMYVYSYVHRFSSFYSKTSCMFNRRLFPVSGVSGFAPALEGDVSCFRTLYIRCSLALSPNSWPKGEAGPVRIGGSCKPSSRAGRLSSRSGSDVMEPVRERGGYGEGYPLPGCAGGWIVEK